MRFAIIMCVRASDEKSYCVAITLHRQSILLYHWFECNLRMFMIYL